MINFGVQTFTIRKQQKKGFEQAYLPIFKMGMKEFELARMKFNLQNAEKIRKLTEKYGMKVVSIQVKPKYVFGNVEEIVAFCHDTGCKNVVISMLPFSCILGPEKKFYEFIATLDKQYEIYRTHGITLAYHHHNWEYVTLSNGKMRMEELLENTTNIRFVHDTYWTTKCGIVSAEQVQQFGDRLLGIHIRDLTLYKKGLKVLSKDAAVGEGVIDFNRVFEAAKKTACEYFVIEQKTDRPYEKLELSYQNCLKITSGMEENKDDE